MKTLEQLVYLKPAEKISIHYYPGKELSIILDGKRLQSNDCSPSMFEKLMRERKDGNIYAIYSLIYRQPGIELDTDMEKINIIRALLSTGDFEVRENSVYLREISHPIPTPLLDELMGICTKCNLDKNLLENNEEFLILKGFWIWVKNLYVTTGREELFEDKFIIGLLEGHHKDRRFFDRCLESEEVIVSLTKREEEANNSVFNIEELNKRITQLNW